MIYGIEGRGNTRKTKNMSKAEEMKTLGAKAISRQYQKRTQRWCQENEENKDSSNSI